MGIPRAIQATFTAIGRRPRAPFGWCVVAALAALAPPGPLSASPASTVEASKAEVSKHVLDRRLSVRLEAAAPLAAFTPLKGALGLERLVLEGLRGEVTMHLDNVRARTVLNALCDTLGCRWTLVADRALLEVRAIGSRPPGAEPRLEVPVSLSLEEADAFDVLIGFGRLLSLNVELEIGTEAKTVTLELDGRPVREALDEVCRQLDCTWRFRATASGAVLEFRGPGADRGRRHRRGAG